MNRIGRDATAILLAGGKSTRMGEDKCLLDIRGRPLISHVLEQLNSQFDEVIVSTGSTAGYPPLEARVIPDKTPDRGPLMGILSSLEASRHCLNFVQACDIPDTDWGLLGRLMERARQGATVVMPRGGTGLLDPLFAVYHRRAIHGINGVLREFGGAARMMVKTCDVQFIDVEDRVLLNLNSMKDYLSYVKN